MLTTKARFFGSLAVGFAVAISHSVFAAYGGYGGYSGWSGYSNSGSGFYGHSSSGGPIISLELDEKKSLDLDLRIAARDNRASDLAELLKQGADLNAQSESGQTALMYAARACAVESAKTLLEKNANINLRDEHGENALMYAVSEGCIPVTRMIVKRADLVLNVVDDRHLTALDYARQGVQLEVDGPSYEILRLLERAETLKKHRLHASLSDDFRHRKIRR
jgi:hypothetical protein